MNSHNEVVAAEDMGEGWSQEKDRTFPKLQKRNPRDLMFCIQGGEAARDYSAAALLLQRKMVKLSFSDHTDNVHLH